MVKIKWFEKYGLGTIDLGDVNAAGYRRFTVTKELMNALERFVNDAWDFEYLKEGYYNIREANGGKSISFGIYDSQGVAGMFHRGGNIEYLSMFSKWVAKNYKVVL